MAPRTPKLPPAIPLDEEQKMMFEALAQDPKIIEYYRSKGPPCLLEDSAPSTQKQDSSRGLVLKDGTETQVTHLYCILCKADPTIPREAAVKAYRSAELNAHLRGKEHTRREQLRRAFKNDCLYSKAGEASCPLCRQTFGCDDKFLAHVLEVHPHELWPKEDDAEQPEDVREVIEESDDDVMLFDQV